MSGQIFSASASATASAKEYIGIGTTGTTGTTVTTSNIAITTTAVISKVLIMTYDPFTQK